MNNDLVQTKVGEFFCNVNDFCLHDDGAQDFLLVCSDSEKYRSRIIRANYDGDIVRTIIDIPTWILSMISVGKDEYYAGTAGGRILHIYKDHYDIVQDDLPFVSGFYRTQEGNILAFGWHGLLLDASDWTRLETGTKSRIFDIATRDDEILYCGENGLFGSLSKGTFRIDDFGTNARCRSILVFEKNIYVFTEARIFGKIGNSQITIHDIDATTIWDSAISNELIVLAAGHEGVFAISNGKILQLTEKHAFRIGTIKKNIYFLSESSAHIYSQDSCSEVSFEKNYRDMVATIDEGSDMV